MFAIFERFVKFLLNEDLESAWEADRVDAMESQTLITPSTPKRVALLPVTPKSDRKRTGRSKGSRPATGLSPKQKQRIRKSTRARNLAQAAADGKRLYEIRTGNSAWTSTGQKANRSCKPKGSQNATSTFSSLKPSDAKDFPLAEHDAPVSVMSSIQEASATAPLDAGGRTLRPVDLQYAYKWFHLARKMVLDEGRKDYKLAYACHARAFVFMVYCGWINLNDALAWKHGRHLLGKGLVELSADRNGLESLDAVGEVNKPTKSAVADFQRGWPRSTDPANNYNWKADAEDKKKHGPFGHAIARYATPEIQEEVLKALLRSDVSPDKVNLPGNWKPLFLPLFRRKRVPEETGDDQDSREDPTDKAEETHTFQRRVDNRAEQDDCEMRQDKGKGKAGHEVQRDKGETEFSQVWGDKEATRSFEMRIDEEGSGISEMRMDEGGTGLYKLWGNEREAGPSGVQADEGTKYFNDVRMDEECVGESYNVRTDNSEADMSFVLTGPPQVTNPQLGERRQFSSVAGPSECAPDGASAEYAQKRAKRVGASQTRTSSASNRPRPRLPGRGHHGQRANGRFPASNTSNVDAFVPNSFETKNTPNFA